MKCRVISALIGIFGLTLCLASPSARADNFEIVVKYSGNIIKMPGAPAHDAFQGMVMLNGPVLVFLIPNVPANPEKYNPEPAVLGMVKGLKAGDLISIVCGPPKGRAPIMIDTAKAYTMKSGEDDPHGLVFVEKFDRKNGDQTTNFVTLSKFLQKTFYKLPAYKDANGDMVTDDAIAGIVEHLKPGEVVYAVTIGSGANQTIKLIAPWKNHFTGKFVKLDPAATVDSNNDTGPAVEITGPDGKTVTAIIPGVVNGKKWTPDATILGVAHGMKENADVDYITADSGDKRIWLVAISKAKPEPHEPHAGVSRTNG